MQSSLLDSIFPSSGPLLPQHDRRSSLSPSSTASSSAKVSRPAPVSGSTILRPTSVSASLSHHSNPILPINRAAKSLQRTIQSLLDAQSEGLIAGLTSNNGQDDFSSNGSLTPTPTMSSATTSRKPTPIPIRQPPQKKISLRGARRGLSRSMHEFASLRQQEQRILEAQVREREDALKTVEAFQSKHDGIQSEIASISSENGARTAGHLRAEANRLDIEIRELENRLFEMKARHRHVIGEAELLENSVQSKLSSYNASLELLDKDIKRFLARPPITQPSSGIARNPVDGIGVENFYALNPKRRTLQMATEHWRAEQEDLKRRKEAIELEMTALQEGGKVWRKVVIEIQAFEKDLKIQMQKLSIGTISQHERDDGMATLLRGMDNVMGFLDQSLQEAEDKDWKLLICCIGAELEAFREGREILIQASGLRDTNAPKEGEQNGVLDNERGDAAAASTSTAPKSRVEPFLHQPQVSLNPQDEQSPTDYGCGSGSTILSNPFRPNPSKHDTDGTRAEHDLLPNLARTETETGTEEVARFDSRSSSSEISENDDPGPDFLISHT